MLGMVPCVVYVTAAVFTDSLRSLWTDNLKDSNCTLRYYSDEDLLASSQRLGIGDAVRSVAPWAYKADLWRYGILLDEGGMYFDAELRLFMPPERIFSLASNQLMVFQDRSDKCMYNAAMASPPGSFALRWVLQRALENVRTHSYGHKDSLEEPWLGITGPCTMARALQNAESGSVIVSGRYDGQCGRAGGLLVFCNNNVVKESSVLGADRTAKAHYGWFWKERKVYNVPK